MSAKMFGLAGLKESLFGVFYIMNESSSQHKTGTWQLRLCVLGFLLDAGQVAWLFVLCPIFSLERDVEIFPQVLRVLISFRS